MSGEAFVEFTRSSFAPHTLVRKRFLAGVMSRRLFLHLTYPCFDGGPSLNGDREALPRVQLLAYSKVSLAPLEKKKKPSTQEASYRVGKQVGILKLLMHRGGM